MPDLRKVSFVGAAIAVAAWAAAISAFHFGQVQAWRLLILVFAAGALGAGICWVVYCGQLALRWLSNKRG